MLGLSRVHQAAASIVIALTESALVIRVLASSCTFSNKLPFGDNNIAHLPPLAFEGMEFFSLKRSTIADRGQANLSSKVYVRSTKSGKVQKIVRELYLRQDIPCSSNLCRACLEIAPTDYSNKGRSLG